MDEGNFASLDDENGWGYSVDNIHPSTPGEMMASSSEQDVNISWSYTQDIDFDYHKITDINLAELYTIENDISITLEQGYNEYHVNTLDIHENESDDSEYAGGHNLHYGANLVSFSIIPEDNSLENMLSECDITDIIGEGKAASNTGSGWIGNIDELSVGEGYWVKANSGHICPTVGMNAIANEYDLHIGANLISYACDEDGALEEFDICNGDIISIIGEGEAASCVNGEWIGNLDQLSPGRGYWFKLSTALTWDFDCPEPSGSSREYFAYELSLIHI